MQAIKKRLHLNKIIFHPFLFKVRVIFCSHFVKKVLNFGIKYVIIIDRSEYICKFSTAALRICISGGYISGRMETYNES